MKRLAGFILLLFSISLHAQVHLGELAPAGGGPYQFQAVEEISPSQRQAIVNMLEQNIQLLKQSGIELKKDPTLQVAFSWPLRKAAGFTDNGYYGISNYIDRSAGAPQLLEYNCGTRTYSGHRGTDIFTWPFPWAKMTSNAVEVIAAANGVIIGKSDGNFDQSCAMCSSCQWNAVYVQQGDGSIAWYGHLKTGSLTSKNIGQTVVAGEYLGIVGSSGSSTGPHLHLEVSLNNVLIDPWNGGCNSNASWWANQEPYRVSTLNALMTHYAAPTSGCFGQETVNQSNVFAPGQLFYLGTYYRDQQAGQVVTHKIYYPNNTLWVSWNQTFVGTYNASWWYFTQILPTTGNIYGTWRYEVTYGTDVLSTSFTVASPDLSITDQNINPGSVAAGGTITATYKVLNGGNGESGNHKTRFYLSADNVLTPGANGDILLGDQDVTSIPSANNSGVLSKQLSVPCSVAPGNYQVLFEADGGNLVTETNEGNNLASSPLAVSAACTSTAIPEIDGLERLVISPNPFNGPLVLDLKLNRPRLVSISMIDVIGREIFRAANRVVSGSYVHEINLKNLQPGVYFLRVNVGNQLVNRKLVKD